MTIAEHRDRARGVDTRAFLGLARASVGFGDRSLREDTVGGVVDVKQPGTAGQYQQVGKQRADRIGQLLTRTTASGQGFLSSFLLQPALTFSPVLIEHRRGRHWHPKKLL